MKLFDVKPNTRVKVVSEARVPPYATEVQEEEVLLFSRIDGMYSYCTNAKGEVVHLVAWAEVEPVNE